MKKKVEGRKLINAIYIVIIIAIIFSNLFSYKLSIFLKLTPDYEFVNATEIHFINVGQGDAIAIKFDNGKTMLIDSGVAEYKENLDYYLKNIILNKNKMIDYLVLTHIDNDHSGNMVHLLHEYKIGVIYRPQILAKIEDPDTTNSNNIYDEMIKTAISKNIELRFNKFGNSLVVGNNVLSWLSPINIDYKEDVASNDYSPVIRLDYNNHSALFTGDISSDVEEELLNFYSIETLDVDILKIAHHGSAYSNSAEFINATSPQFACVSVGKNTYGHPSNMFIERILEYDNLNNSSLYDNLYSTKDNGNVIFTLKNDIDVNLIDNINNYSFTSYYLYSTIAILLLLFNMLSPYYKIYLKNRRFIKQNKEFEENVKLQQNQ